MICCQSLWNLPRSTKTDVISVREYIYECLISNATWNFVQSTVHGSQILSSCKLKKTVFRKQSLAESISKWGRQSEWNRPLCFWRAFKSWMLYDALWSAIIFLPVCFAWNKNWFRIQSEYISQSISHIIGREFIAHHAGYINSHILNEHGKTASFSCYYCLEGKMIATTLRLGLLRKHV